MTYLSGKTQKRRDYRRYAFFVVIFLSIVIFWPSVKKFSYKILEPVLIRYGVTKQSFAVFPEFLSTYITSHKTLALKNKELTLEVERLTSALAEKDAYLREISPGAVFLNENTPIVMYPLLQDVTRLYSTILFSKGFKDGVTTESIVYLKGNQAVCKIKEVYTSSSLCLLLTSADATTEGVTSSSTVNLSLTGRGGYYVANILRDTPVLKGELVYMKSNPKITLGTVREVSHNNQDTSWHVFIEGAYNPLTSSIFYVQP